MWGCLTAVVHQAEASLQVTHWQDVPASHQMQMEWQQQAGGLLGHRHVALGLSVKPAMQVFAAISSHCTQQHMLHQ
jgi:hypothetical protein